MAEGAIEGFSTTSEEPLYEVQRDEQGNKHFVLSYRALVLANKPGGRDLIANIIKAKHGPSSHEPVDRVLSAMAAMGKPDSPLFDVRDELDATGELTILAELDDALSQHRYSPVDEEGLAGVLRQSRGPRGRRRPLLARIPPSECLESV